MGDLQLRIEEFGANMELRRDLSENTRISYRRDLNQMSAYMERMGVTDIAEVSQVRLWDYIRELETEHKNPATISRTIASMRAFFRYLVQQGIRQDNPADDLKAPRVEKSVPYILTPEEVSRLLRQPAGDTPKAYRDRAMLELLYATGIRVSELIQLNLEDVNLMMDYIVSRKGNRERVIPFGKSAKIALREYLDKGRPKLIKEKENQLLFTNLSGKKMSRQGFWKLVRQYGQAAGIGEELTPHTLRHSFAAHLVNNGADLYALQEMMGYADLSAASVYANMRKASIREVYHKAHPRAYAEHEK